MRKGILLFFVLAYFCLKAQDKIYFLNGTSKVCKIESITSDYFNIRIGESEQSISKLEVILVEFKNGSIEVCNAPKEDIIYNPLSTSFADASKPKKIYKVNFASINTLALCNADISAFYEFIPKKRFLGDMSVGIGLMGAYNFNLHTGLQNVFLSVVNNAKKNYDLGATFNVYPFDFSDDLEIYFGMMMKYTDFNFDKVKLDTISSPAGIQQTVSFSKAHGYQLATLFTAGAHYSISEHFFLRGFIGLGAFNLRGVYKEQYNIEINKNNNGKNRNVSTLIKAYLGVNVGFNF